MQPPASRTLYIFLQGIMSFSTVNEMPAVPHRNYCMKDGVFFQVEDVLFRVPRYMLELSSPILSKMLEDVRPIDVPILLPDVKSEEFEHLLTLLYPLSPQLVSDLESYASCDNETQRWISILRLATIWDMQNIRIAAMGILSHSIQDPMTKIALGKQYNHIPWLREGFTTLSVRPEPLSIAEASQLTKEDIVACAAAREGIRGLKGIQLPTGEGPSTYRKYDNLIINHSVCRIIEGAFRFSREKIPEGSESKDTRSELEIKEASYDTHKDPSSFKFISNFASASRELFLGQYWQRLLLVCWRKGIPKTRLFPSADLGCSGPIRKLATKEYLAGLACLILFAMGVLVITW